MPEQKNEITETNIFSRLLELYNTPAIQNLMSLAYSGAYFAGIMNNRTQSESKTLDTLLSTFTAPFAFLGIFHLHQTNIPSLLANKCNTSISVISNQLLQLEQYLRDSKISEKITNAERVTLIISNLLQLIANYEQYNKTSSTDEQENSLNTLKMAIMTIYLVGATINHLYCLGVFKKLAELPFNPINSQNLTISKTKNQKDQFVTESDIIKKMDACSESIKKELDKLTLTSINANKPDSIIFSEKPNRAIKNPKKLKKRKK